MSGNEPSLMENLGTSTGNEAFVLTDEQILDIGSDSADAATQPATTQSLEPAASTLSDEAPRWLAERMRDPWVGEDAKSFWQAAQLAQREAGAYRELFASPEDARAMKELYPGGVTEARSAAERARTLDEFDAAFFGSAGTPADQLLAGRVQLVEKLHSQDPAAFREMVQAGIQILEKQASRGPDSSRSATEKSPQVRTSQATIPQSQERIALEYSQFEKAANADLEKSVGASITRGMQQALPNLRSHDAAAGDSSGQAASLQQRLSAAVREDIEAALKSDTQLGEQVSRILTARRFDASTRSQIVRLIDARAQQLVPGAVRRVVGSWTQATLGGPAKNNPSADSPGRPDRAKPSPAPPPARSPDRNTRAAATSVSRAPARGRVDYHRLSDEQILDL